MGLSLGAKDPKRSQVNRETRFGERQNNLRLRRRREGDIDLRCEASEGQNGAQSQKKNGKRNQHAT